MSRKVKIDRTQQIVDHLGGEEFATAYSLDDVVLMDGRITFTVPSGKISISDNEDGTYFVMGPGYMDSVAAADLRATFDRIA